MFLHSVWRPLLAGAVGAAITAATVIGGVWVVLPKITTHDVVVDHVIPRDVPFDNHTPQTKPFDNYVPHDKPFDLPVPAPKPVADAAPPTMGPDSPYAPKTEDEKKFTANPEYKNATYRGRIVKSRDGSELSFEDGRNFHPAHVIAGTKTVVNDENRAYDSDPFVGDLGMCVQNKDDELWLCTASHNGQAVPITHSQKSASAEPTQPPADLGGGGPTVAAANMVSVKVDVAGYQVEAMVDTGCSWPMAIPSALAQALVRDGRAIFAGVTKTILANGKQVDVDIVLIKSITVDGRTLDSVEAAATQTNGGSTLLGLGALNRLGPFKIEEGRLVFTSEQPA
jgi:hypothetical protein